MTSIASQITSTTQYRTHWRIDINKTNVLLKVTDLGMPGLSGWEVARRIHAVHPEIPVALITGWGDGELTPENIDAAPDLQIIALAGSSVKHISPYHAFEKGITIVNTASAIGDSVAEFALTTALVLLKEITLLNGHLHQGKWMRAEPGRDLTGRTVGVIGAGRIGAAYARMMVEGHKMNLIYYDVHRNEALEDYIAAYAQFLKSRGEAPVTCTRAETIEDLLQQADCVSIHTVLDDTTRHLRWGLPADRSAR